MCDSKHDNFLLLGAINDVKGETLQSGFVDVGRANGRIKVGSGANMRHDRFEFFQIVRAQTGQSVFVEVDVIVVFGSCGAVKPVLRNSARAAALMLHKLSAVAISSPR